MLDGVNVSSWARTQKVIATSSGESELYAMSVGAAEALGFRELLTDIGLPTTVRLRCDYCSHGNCMTSRSWTHETRTGTRSCLATVDCRWPFDPTEDCEFWECCRPSHETCVPECTPVSRPETWSSTITSTQHVCWNVMWTDGRSGTPVYWYVDRWKERCTCVFGWISRRLECAC